MRIIDQIRDRESFTPTENTLAKYLEENSSKVVNMSLEELSSVLYVSKSSIIRFCKKLGFKGHKELCVTLAKEMDTFLYDNEVLNPSNPYRADDTIEKIAGKTYQLCHGALYDTYNNLDFPAISQLAQKVSEQKKLYIYAMEECALCAELLKKNMQSISIDVHTSSFPGAMIENACRQEAGSCALILSYSMYSQEMRRAAEILKDAGVEIYLLSGLDKNPLAGYADHEIRIRYYEPLPKVAQIGSKTAIMFVLDIIYAEIFRLHYDDNIAVIRACEKRRTNH